MISYWMSCSLDWLRGKMQQGASGNERVWQQNVCETESVREERTESKRERVCERVRRVSKRGY